MSTVNIAFAGNPNCGKTTLFNAYTGAKLKVANWPGVTVEKKEGMMKYHDAVYKLVDTPGIYSMSSYTMEEKVTRSYIMGDEVDVIIDVVDASSLERNLYLALQLIEMGKPVVLALNMMDIVEERGMEIDLHRMPEMLGIPTIPVCARKRQGLDILMHAVEHHKNKTIDKTEHHHPNGNHIHAHHDEYVVVYSDDIEDEIDTVSALLKKNYPHLGNFRWYAIKILEHDTDIMEKYDIEYLPKKNYETDIIHQKYDFIEEVISECLVNKDAKSEATDNIDKILTHRIWGVPVFLGIMALVFLLTFTLGDWIKGYFESGLEWFSSAVLHLLDIAGSGNMLKSLIVNGIIAGVGGILTFLPNIFILFLALAFLEDSGYMSRVAYVMDGMMGKLGLSGRAFIPMLLGFGCSVPAVMASRTLENIDDRRRTILITPFMSCSARLPIYVMISSIFFGKFAMLAAYSMYIIGVAVAVLIALVMSRSSKKTYINNLLIELPEYKLPNLRTVIIYVWEKVLDYLTKAGTTIFVASIILWLLLNFNIHGMTDDPSSSFAAQIGHSIAFLLKPAGLGLWQIVVSLISGIAAKEVVVSSMSVLFGISNISSQTGMDSLRTILASDGFGAINAYSLMLFCLLYVPCVATIATIKREVRSLKWTLGAVLVQLGTAWLVSTLFYQIARIIF